MTTFILRIFTLTLAVIIPTLNEAKNLSTLIPYLQSNTNRKNLEIVVVDAPASKDKTKELCRRLNVSYISTTKTSRSHQLNQGSRIAKADILMFLHADVKPPNNFQALIQDTINPTISAGLFSYNLQPSSFFLKINSWCTKFDTRLTGGGNQCFFIKKSTFSYLGGYNEKMIIMEDFELFRRLKYARFRYKLIKEPAIVSSRKYEHNSWLRVNLVNLMMMKKFEAGVSQDELIDFYNYHLSGNRKAQTTSQ